MSSHHTIFIWNVWHLRFGKLFRHSSHHTIFIWNPSFINIFLINHIVYLHQINSTRCHFAVNLICRSIDKSIFLKLIVTSLQFIFVWCPCGVYAWSFSQLIAGLPYRVLFPFYDIRTINMYLLSLGNTSRSKDAESPYGVNLCFIIFYLIRFYISITSFLFLS